MRRPLRHVAVLMLGLFAVLVVNLNVLQVLRADELAEHPANQRLVEARYATRRGPIVIGDEEAAVSIETDDDDPLIYLRTYPFGPTTAHVVGWESLVVGDSGLEEAFDAALTAVPSEALAQNLVGLLTGGQPTGDTVRTTLDLGVQEAAVRALGGRTGAVVALDPTTGEVLAHVSSPSFDPNPLASHDRVAALDAWDAYRSDPAEPLRDRAIRELYPPGSTFKLVVAAAALESGLDLSTAFEDEVEFQPEVGEPIRNFSESTCAGGGTITLIDAIAVSCNTVFAQLGVELGEEALLTQARRFGFDRAIPYELDVAQSVMATDLDAAQLAQSAIGQFDVRATALQMALVSAAIANDGRLQRPSVARDVRAPDGRLVQGSTGGEWDDGPTGAEAVSARTARLLREAMVAVVERGTGRSAAIPGVEVGGKTGTAQDPADPTPTAWFTGFAGDRVAVAVVVPDAGGEGGGSVAAPIARSVMEAALE